MTKEQPSGEEVIRLIRAETDTITLAFSCGKDSIGAWLACRPHFKRIIPIYMWLLPDLEFVERSLVWYEEFFQTQIVRMPHPSCYRWLNSFMFQAPEHLAIIEAAKMPNFNYVDVVDIVREDHKLPKNTFHATGVRAADSPLRRAAVNKYGPINRKTRTFWPVWDWNKARLVSEMKRSRVKLPIDYQLFGRSFDGIDYRFLAPLKQRFPRDYERIIHYFPLAELELKRREYAAQTIR
jgi:hypothetical protein